MLQNEIIIINDNKYVERYNKKWDIMWNSLSENI